MLCCIIAGIPQCLWYGEHDDFACIVIDLLGSSLSQLRETVAYMSIDTVVDLGCQMVNRIISNNYYTCHILTRI